LATLFNVIVISLTINFFNLQLRKPHSELHLPINFIIVMKKYFVVALLSTVLLSSFIMVSKNATTNVAQPSGDTLLFPKEKHFKNIQQLTFGGDNAEAYFSNNGTMLTMQITHPKIGLNCDQIFLMNLADKKLQPISNGKGRTTCSYFLPGDSLILYASTFAAADTCPAVPDRKVLKKYVWPIYPSYDIYVANLKGQIRKQLTHTKGYDAEGTVSPKGDKIIFTSTRNGDIDLYTMNIDGSHVKQITNTLGYDGGATFSPDGKKIVWRASRPKTEIDIKEYKDLLAQNMVAPTQMEVFVANADGSNAQQVTHLGNANWAPSFHPSGKKIIFSSNHEYKRGFPFNLYLVNLDGTGLEKISHDGGFDAFPMFSIDGKKIVFSSNRNNNGGHDTNVFIADWVE
jgi:TolB protein